jgi:hypothetical protein
MRITNVQKKELANIFNKSGLSKLDFDVTGQHKEFKIKFKHDYFSFSINAESSDSYKLIIYDVDNTQPKSLKVTWLSTKKRFERWTQKILQELTTPTGWESFQSDNYLNADFDDLDNKFTDAEKVQVRESIKELSERIKNLELPDKSLIIVNSKLDELSSKVDELKKFDWKALFLGTMASLVITLGFPPETTGLLWDYIKMAFRGLRLNG